MSVERITNPYHRERSVRSGTNLRRLLAIVVIALLVTPAISLGQPTFSIDFQGPTIAIPDAFGTGIPISEGDILVAGTGIPAPGPGLPPPGIGSTAGFSGFLPDLGLPVYVIGGSTPGVPGLVEVDALSYGKDFSFGPNTPPHEVLYNFSVDEFAVGFLTGPAPEVFTEGAFGNSEASADTYVSFPPGACPPAPTPPLGCPPGNTMLFDGSGVAPPLVPAIPPGLPLAPPGFFFGLGLIEPNFPTPLVLPDPGDNLDALDMDTPAPPNPFPVYFSLDSAFPDPLELLPANSGSAMAQGLGFVGGDVLVSPVPGGPPIVFAPAALLGLDLILGPDTDDLDALVLVENGTGVYEPSKTPFDWVPSIGGVAPVDMLLFSVRRGSAVIGSPDSIFGVAISEGDILTTPLPPALGGLSPFPGLFMAAENLGLATARSGFPTYSGLLDDDLDALDIARDCDASSVPDILDVLYGTAPDCNGNMSPDSCDIVDGISADCNGNGKPDECEPNSAFADLDSDGDVDATDFLTFSNCFNGSLNPPKPACANLCSDIDHDGDVDATDFLTFSNCFNGSLKPPNPC